jgi:hypothetical protein
MENNKAINRRKRSNEAYIKRQKELIDNLSDEERADLFKHQEYLFSRNEFISGESWVKINGWEDLYEISNYGRIKRIADGNIRSPHLHHSCYYTISLHGGSKKDVKYFILSRLLAINFIKNEGNLPEVNHKNKIRIDCRLNNLEWASSKSNHKHKMIVQCAYDNRRSVVQLSMSGEFIKEWDSVSSAAESVGKKGANITTVCQNKNNYAYKHIWMYKDDYELNGLKNRHIFKKYRL